MFTHLRMRMAATALLAALTGAAHAETYYVAPNGSPRNNGSRAKPWTLDRAVKQLKGGDTVIVRPGLYIGGTTVPGSASGTKERPTVIKSEKKWQAVISGSARSHGLGTTTDCSWVVFDGFEMMGNDNGISLNGPNNTVRNCWVHNNWAMGISGTNGETVENCVIEFNGSHPHLHHGAYISGDGLQIRNNIVRRNSGYGLHLYPKVTNSVVANNVVYANGECGIIVTCPHDGSGGNNLIVNNTVVNNPCGIQIPHGNQEKLFNNIVVGKEHTILIDRDVKLIADYNLCVPASPLQGPHGMSADPGLSIRAGIASGSKPTARHAAREARNTRQRPISGGGLGPRTRRRTWARLTYSAHWADKSAIPGRPDGHNWPYRFAPLPGVGMEMPDMWFLPKDEK